ncbi:MAG TPA: nucleoside triphosphate pyrophosphohydrolase [Gammaproteobacteria bacterium]|nr:nucleoside triphosphate pyrophosphohydrolase [Gammaproteobacteria bacterium]
MTSALEDLLALMRRLRDPERGCPWDRAQTPASLVRHTLEEAYEVADCIEREDWRALPGELGDLLFQVVFYAQIGAEEGRYDFEAVCRGLVDKLTRRHPHVFGDEPRGDAAAQSRRWEEIKAAERAQGARASAVDDLPRALPALSRASKLQQRAARVGFDWPSLPPVVEKLREETAELDAALAAGDRAAVAHELGDLLFTCVNLARHLGLDAESTLRAANARFERRFRALETRAVAAGHAPDRLDAAALDALWQAIKAEER